MHNSNSMKKFKNLTILINQATPQVCLAYLIVIKVIGAKPLCTAEYS